MAPSPNAAPKLFDLPLLQARQRRALRLGPATFLLDRVADDMEERLHAGLRAFSDDAEICTPGPGLLTPARAGFTSVIQIGLHHPEQEILPLQPESLYRVVYPRAF